MNNPTELLRHNSRGKNQRKKFRLFFLESHRENDAEGFRNEIEASRVPNVFNLFKKLFLKMDFNFRHAEIAPWHNGWRNRSPFQRSHVNDLAK